MENLLQFSDAVPAGESFALVVSGDKKLTSSLLGKAEKAFLEEAHALDPEKSMITLQRLGQWVAVVFIKPTASEVARLEECRRQGSRLADLTAEHRLETFSLVSNDITFRELASMAEGMMLSTYRYLPFFSAEKQQKMSNPLIHIHLVHKKFDASLIQWLTTSIRYTFLVRDLVNEPPSEQNAEKFAAAITAKAGALGIRTEVLGKKKIEALKMGGLLAVNRGSIDPPTFTVLEWKPENAVNEKPVVLVGKGVIFDTGGMNLKTGLSMDGMKSDMAGAAMMAATLMAVAESKLPVHVIALIPATDNRVNGNAFLPGDVITMHNGTTVEIKNTDAEGRLLLGDAISYAARFNPGLVITSATLTGAAMRAIGHYGIVAMEENATKEMQVLKEAGEEVYERIAEFPMWKEYEDQLKSDIADLANLGTPNGSAITAAKFLARFTTAPFIHLDIAGPAFTEKKEHYIPKGATGMGVRLLLRFLEKLQRTLS